MTADRTHEDEARERKAQRLAAAFVMQCRQHSQTVTEEEIAAAARLLSEDRWAVFAEQVCERAPSAHTVNRVRQILAERADRPRVDRLTRALRIGGRP